jgi:hypothetical protein
MVHCGYEASAVADTVAHPIKALGVWLRGIRTDRPMVPDIPLHNQRPAQFVFDDVVRTMSERAAEEARNRSDAA